MIWHGKPVRNIERVNFRSEQQRTIRTLPYPQATLRGQIESDQA